MAFKLNTLHIFGYGEVQAIGTDGETSINKKAPASALTKVAAVVDDVYSHKPAENPAPNEYHAVNVFNDMFADYQPSGKGAKGWRTQFGDLNKVAIDELAAEVLAYNPA